MRIFREQTTNNSQLAVFTFTLAFLTTGPVKAAPPVLFGIDVLEEQGFAPLKGKRVGLITNDAARDARSRRTLDVLRKAPGVSLAAVFAPEHGLAATLEHGRPVSDGPDAGTGLVVHSLYGISKRPTPAMLEGLDALVFDMQDVGTRFYTYSTTMAYALEEAARAGIGFIVLDRPNPVTGSVVEGEILEDGIRAFTAYLPVPVRHGMTMGELARFHDRSAGLRARLTVVPARGWSRMMWWEETGLPFHPPSPNIRSPLGALLYSGIGAFEATNVAVGRGTDRPFEVFGAPWMDARRVARRLNEAGLPGLRFSPVRFRPDKDLYRGRLCRGVRVEVTDRGRARPLEAFARAVFILAGLHPADFVPRWDEVAQVTGSRALEKAVQSGQDPDLLLAHWAESARRFRRIRKEALLYEE